jgi:hypothetical protein
MNDWQTIIVEELKSINRKLERLEDNLEGQVRTLEHDFHNELAPIKKHVTQVKLISVLFTTIVPLALAAYKVFH